MNYTVLGFFLRSGIEFPELHNVGADARPGTGNRVVDVLLGDVPEDLPDGHCPFGWFVYEGDRCLFRLDDVGRMLVEGGMRITVTLAPGARMSDMRTYILATGMATVIHQLGLVPLHVGAVLSPKGVIAFTGPSGAGKSTAVAGISAELGWSILGDDVAVLSLDQGVPVVEGGVRRLRLWSDAIARFGWNAEGMERDLHRADKFVTYDHGAFLDGSHPLVGLYEIIPDGHDGPVETLRGVEKLSTLLGAVFRPFLVGPCGNQRNLQRVVAGSVNRIACWRGGRPDPVLVRDLIQLLD